MKGPQDVVRAHIDRAEEVVRRRRQKRHDHNAVEGAAGSRQPPSHRDDESARSVHPAERCVDQELVAARRRQPLEQVIVAPRLADKGALRGVANHAVGIGH